MDISKLDTNFALGEVDSRGIVFRDAKETPFRIYGVFHDGTQYRRVPEDVAAATSEHVAVLSTHTAGGRVRFVTDSKRIVIKPLYADIHRMAHMAFTGIFGFDLFVDDEFKKVFTPPVNVKDSYESMHEFPTKEKRLITINMPLYAPVKELFIGLEEGATLEAAPDHAIECPIVFYGSSITQGGCASRPGTAYTAVVSRWLGANHINIGFSGSARGEAAIRDYIASLDMSLFVLDYDHNAKSIEEYESTHYPFYKAVREAHPDIPIIIITRPKVDPTYQLNALGKARIARETYQRALDEGDKRVYFIDGKTLMPEDMGDDGLVDGVHPTDLGFYFMAKRVYPVIKESLKI